MIIEIDDLYTGDIIEYLKDNNLIPNTKDFESDKNSLVLSTQIQVEIESELKVQLIEEINSRGLIYETLKGVMEDYFDEFDIKTHTSIERDMNQVTYGKDDEY